MASTRLTRDVPGMSGFDPEHTARVVAWLAAPGCPVNGQVLAVRGTTVTLLDGWRAGRSVTGDDGPWTVAELTEAMTALPRRDPLEEAMALVGGGLGSAGRDTLLALVDAMLADAG
jgi:hypothetical protein